MAGARPVGVGEAGRIDDEGDDRGVGGGVEKTVAAGCERPAHRCADLLRPDRAAVVAGEGDDLAAGGSDAPENLLRPMGVDITNPSFWQLGLEPLERMIAEAERMTS